MIPPTFRWCPANPLKLGQRAHQGFHKRRPATSPVSYCKPRVYCSTYLLQLRTTRGAVLFVERSLISESRLGYTWHSPGISHQNLLIQQTREHEGLMSSQAEVPCHRNVLFPYQRRRVYTYKPEMRLGQPQHIKHNAHVAVLCSNTQSGCYHSQFPQAQPSMLVLSSHDEACVRGTATRLCCRRWKGILSVQPGDHAAHIRYSNPPYRSHNLRPSGNIFIGPCGYFTQQPMYGRKPSCRGGTP